MSDDGPRPHEQPDPSPRAGGGPTRGRPAQPAASGDDPVALARSIALRQLTAAPRSRSELEQAMARRGVPAEAARAVLDRFEEVALVDDTAYAAMLVRSRQASKGLARRGLAHELRAKGIDDATAREALEQVGADDELATARSLVARRLGSTSRLEPVVRQRRLVGMLARKGYPPGLALRVVREALADDSAGEAAGEVAGAAGGLAEGAADDARGLDDL